MAAFIGDADAIVSVELSGAHWHVVYQLLTTFPAPVAVMLGMIDEDAARCVTDAADAIFTACANDPSSIPDPTTGGE